MLPIKIKLSDDFFKEETKCGFLVTTERKKLWAVILDMMCELDRVCRKHGIRYFLDGGTFLGAVRHKGFIPWDDDGDIIMYRADYERLCEVAPDEFKHPYFLQTNESDPGSVRGHAQLRNSATTGILNCEVKDGRAQYTFNQGVFLDIFIFDAVPDRAEELDFYREELHMHKDILWALKQQYFKDGCPEWVKDDLMHEARRFDAIVSRYNDSANKRMANISLNPYVKESMLFDRNLYMESAEYEFEGMTFPGPNDYETVLTGIYGDWHEYVIGTSMHGGTFFDMEKPYTYYLDNGMPEQPQEQAEAQPEPKKKGRLSRIAAKIRKAFSGKHQA